MSKNTIQPSDKDAIDNAGMPVIGKKKRSGKMLNLIVLTSIAGVGLTWAVVSSAGGKHGEASLAKRNEPELAARVAPMPEPPPPPPEPEPAAAAAAQPASYTTPAPEQTQAQRVPTWEERKLGFFIADGSPIEDQSAARGTQLAGQPRNPSQPAREPADQEPAPRSEPDPAVQQSRAAATLGGRLEAPAYEMNRATLLPDRNYVLAAGTAVDCQMDTPVNTTQPGPVKCHLPYDVYSDNKQVLLMEKGTEFIGQQTGGIQQGQDRAFALFRRAKTPKGVIVTLNSAAADAQGVAGIPGWVDAQTMKRFGAAVGFALLQDATALAVARKSSGGGQNTLVLGNTTQAASSVVEKTLDASINIPPVLRTNQGTMIKVILAADLSFDVYALKAVQP